MNLEKVTGKNVMKKCAIFVSKKLVLGVFCHEGKLTFLESLTKEDSFDTHHNHIK
jgi:hypothetical protein